MANFLMFISKIMKRPALVSLACPSKPSRPHRYSQKTEVVGTKSLEKIDAEWLEFSEKYIKGPPPAGWISYARYMSLTGFTIHRAKFFFRKQLARGAVRREMFSEMGYDGRIALVPHFLIVKNKQ